MHFQLLSVSPSWAAELLARHNQSNRPINQNSVQRMASDMRMGRWVTTHQAIAIDTEGEIQDGQHRLRAVVEADIQVPMWVAFDCAPEARTFIDLGVSRTVAHILAIEDGKDGNNTTRGAAARVILMYDNVPESVWSTGTVAEYTSKSAIIDLAKRESSSLSQAAVIGRELALRIPVLSPSYGAAFMYLVWRDSQVAERADDFVTGLLTGESLTAGDPRLYMREHGRTGGRDRSAWGYQKGLAQMLLTWNRWVAGRNDVTMTRFNRNMLPMPKVD